MKKKTKIIYIAVAILNAILCVFDICTSNYIGAIISGLNVAWMCLCYSLINIISQQDKMIEDYRILLKEVIYGNNGDHR